MQETDKMATRKIDHSKTELEACLREKALLAERERLQGEIKELQVQVFNHISKFSSNSLAELADIFGWNGIHTKNVRSSVGTGLHVIALCSLYCMQIMHNLICESARDATYLYFWFVRTSHFCLCN